jgi:hypothetical protein
VLQYHMHDRSIWNGIGGLLESLTIISEVWKLKGREKRNDEKLISTRLWNPTKTIVCSIINVFFKNILST